MNKDILILFQEALSQNLEIKATDLIVDYFDNLFSKGKFELASDLLSNLNDKNLSVQTITGILSITKFAKKELGSSRIEFINHAKKLFLNELNLSEERIILIMKRLE